MDEPPDPASDSGRCERSISGVGLRYTFSQRKKRKKRVRLEPIIPLVSVSLSL